MGLMIGPEIFDDETPDPENENGICSRCGDPLPLDGRCDCAGDADRDYATGLRGLGSHALMVRLGPETGEEGGEGEVVEMWV